MAVVLNGTSGLTLESNDSRITGDFSNTVSGFSRTMFQSRIADGATHVFAMPNSTANLATFGAISSNTPNHNAIWIQASSTAGVISSTKGGTASYPPMIFSTSDVEQMRLAANGNIGIGVTAPGYKLEIATGSGQFTTAIYIQPSTHATSRRAAISIGSWLLDQDISGNGTKDFGIYDSVANASRMTIDTSGNALFSQNVTAYSDFKLKTDISTIENALDKVSKMRGVMYTRKDTGLRGTGVIAQEIQKVLPEVVIEGESLSVAYGNIVGLLIEAIKELKAEIEQLKGK
jgi:hypothetical protein